MFFILYTREDIDRGQSVWQSIGGMQQGSIWGHGSYLAPDWSADWLHREATALLALSAKQNPYDSVSPDQRQIIHRAAIQDEMRRNTFNPETQAITVSAMRAEAIKEVQAHFTRLYVGEGDAALALRRDYAFSLHAFLTPSEAHDLSAFYFWTSWSATTNRPDNTITYTSNWPHELLVGNQPTTATLMWSLVSVILLLAGIGALVWYYVRQFDTWNDDVVPEEGFAAEDLIDNAVITPSMRATAKYFWVVCALFLTQVLLGIITAHYAVEGQGIYGLPFVDYFPYTVTRTWHTQLAVLWIATAWLATGLYVAPLLAGKDPKYQVFGVNFLFISLLLIVVGSFVGQWAAVHRLFEDMTANFWFGHQGYEYVDLGRFWQIYLTIGLFLWVALVLRALQPVLVAKGSKSLIALVVISATAIGLL